jgi:hypothetical protein
MNKPTAKLARFSERGDSSGMHLWVSVLVTWLVALAALRVFPPHYGRDSAHYLLSSLPQCLSAVLALTLTLPVALAGLSGYVLDEAQRMVRHRVFILYVVLYAGSILFCVVVLRWRQPVSWALDLAISLASACLLSLLFFARWVAGRIRPSNYIDRLMARIYRLALEAGQRRKSTPELDEAISQAVNVARLAIRNGATHYWRLVVDRLLRFWILGSLDQDLWLALKAEEALKLTIPASARDSCEFVMETLREFFKSEYYRGTKLAAIGRDRVLALEAMLREFLVTRWLDEPQWSATCKAMWMIGTILTEDLDQPEESVSELTAARELATFARFTLRDALMHTLARLRMQYPKASPSDIDREGRNHITFAFDQLRDMTVASISELDPFNPKYARKEAQFAKYVDISEVLRTSGIGESGGGS